MKNIPTIAIYDSARERHRCHRVKTLAVELNINNTTATTNNSNSIATFAYNCSGSCTLR
jgi:hypothetical protein